MNYYLLKKEEEDQKKRLCMNKEDTHEILKELDYRREISKLKLEIKKRDKLIQRLKEKIKKLEKR